MIKKVIIGSKVHFKHNGRLYIRRYDYLDGQPIGKVVSPDSPVGRAIHNKNAGDKMIANTPGGPVEIEIIKVIKE